jgi:hypothetical protein
MKQKLLFSVLIVFAFVAVLAVPAFAQLGDTDVSSFTVQNVSDGNADVTITFIAEDGTQSTPSDLGGGVSNPFTLAEGESQQIYVPDVPSLASGRYAVMISSTAKVAAIASVSGTGSTRFTGSYTGFSEGANTFYLPTFSYNFYGWYSMISVQNIGTGPADVEVNISCENGATGTLSEDDIPALASHTFVLKSETPDGFTSTTRCIGSAVVSSPDQPVIATDSQNKPADGNTNTFSGVISGNNKLYVPALTNDYYGWNHSLNILKLGSGSTTVTVEYSDGAPDSTCNLTNSKPSCQLYIPSAHAATGLFGATITSSPSMELVAVANSSKGKLSSSYNAVGDGSGSAEVSMTEVVKAFYKWNSSWTCQNVGSADTKIEVEYQGYSGDSYTHPKTLSSGDTVQVYVPDEPFLPDNYQGGATITAKNSSADIACIVDFTNQNWKNASLPGDWTQGYNAYNK